MTKQVIPREQAHRDVEEAIDYYVDRSGAATALKLVDALENAYRLISRRPATGSLHYGRLLDLPGLRHRALRRFPYLVFYPERLEWIDVWRVLHSAQDIPALMPSVQVG